MELDGFKDLEQQRQAREDFFEKAFDPTYIEKGKRGGTGEIRQWKDGKYQKQSDGTWKPVKDGGGKTAKDKPVGSIHEHNGKKYKKQANGKWIEVSDSYGMSKKEHEGEIKNAQKTEENQGNEISDRRKAQDEQNKHHSAASKLSDKEHTDEEVGLGSKKEEPKKSERIDEDEVGKILKSEGLGDVMNTTWPEEFESSKKYKPGMTTEEYAKALAEYIKNN